MLIYFWWEKKWGQAEGSVWPYWHWMGVEVFRAIKDTPAPTPEVKDFIQKFQKGPASSSRLDREETTGCLLSILTTTGAATFSLITIVIA